MQGGQHTPSNATPYMISTPFFHITTAPSSTMNSVTPVPRSPHGKCSSTETDIVYRHNRLSWCTYPRVGQCVCVCLCACVFVHLPPVHAVSHYQNCNISLGSSELRIL